MLGMRLLLIMHRKSCRSIPLVTRTSIKFDNDRSNHGHFQKPAPGNGAGILCFTFDDLELNGQTSCLCHVQMPIVSLKIWFITVLVP